MSNSIFKRFRKSTLFEKLLLFVGIALGIIGFWLINTIYNLNPVLSVNFLMLVFLWLLLIFVVILTASNESIKEDLGIIIKQHIEETKLIKEEIKILNSALQKSKKSIRI